MAWHPHLEVWALCLTMLGGYALAIRKVGPRRVTGDEPVVTRGQIWAFSLGVLAIWVAADWPVHEISERYLLSAHMVQHLLLSLVAPPLLLLGTPAWLARALLPRPLLRVVRRLSRPLVALILFNAVIALTHWTVLVDLALRAEGVHFGIHLALFGSATLMWMPVLSPLLEVPRLPYPGQMMFLFAQSIVPTVPASFLTFGNTVLYRAYAEAPRFFGISAIDDQRVAGLIMKIVGGLLLWAVIAVLFFRWHRQEQTDGVDALAWRNVDRDIDRARLSR